MRWALATGLETEGRQKNTRAARLNNGQNPLQLLREALNEAYGAAESVTKGWVFRRLEGITDAKPKVASVSSAKICPGLSSDQCSNDAGTTRKAQIYSVHTERTVAERLLHDRTTLCKTRVSRQITGCCSSSYLMGRKQAA